jgi:bis(5'-nucleosyl)-tetraphosphatase (symmetrical)
MATYAVGDIQGCHRTLLELLDHVGFDAGRDRLWLTGDLVNRGPRSLETLRWARGLGERHVAVLGNHDLHLLAVAAGIRAARENDTLQAVLDAPDRDGLLDWLAARPFFHREGGFAIVHAGVHPAWSSEDVERLAREAHHALTGDRTGMLVRHFRNRGNDTWVPGMEPRDELQVAVNAFTRLRVVDAGGRMHLDHKQGPERAPRGSRPWFEAYAGNDPYARILFGHWSVLGLKITPHAVGLDTGCVWGGDLTAYRLEDGSVFSVPCADRP